MSGQKKSSGPISAAELMAKLQNDPDYHRRTQAAEASRQVRVRELRRAEQPIVVALRNEGLQVDSVWDLVNTSRPYPAALPILLEQLERGGYPDMVMESLGRALAVPSAVAYWKRLKALYTAARNPGEEDGVAVALAACATDAQLEDLTYFLTLSERGDSRIYFIRPILKVGGNRGRDIVQSLRDNPTFRKEVQALLKQ